jgi:hypothetical protein
MKRIINNGTVGHRGLVRNGVAMTEEIRWTDEETRKYFTDNDGQVHSVVFTDPITGERRFGR